MVNTFAIEINGVSRTWAFNNYALVELSHLLSKVLTEEEMKDVSLDPASILPAIMKLAAENYIMAVTVILYAGLVGFELSRMNRKHGLTPEIVSQFMADGNEMEVTQCWKLFLEATDISGVLKKITENVTEPDDEKKK